MFGTLYYCNRDIVPDLLGVNYLLNDSFIHNKSMGFTVNLEAFDIL